MASKYNTDIKRNIGKIENRGKEGYTKLGLPRKKLGRPVDPYKDLPLLEQRKIYREMHRNGERLTVAQTAVAMWNPETESKPLSKMAVLKIEQKALAKMKAKLAALGLNSINDIIEPKRGAHDEVVEM